VILQQKNSCVAKLATSFRLPVEVRSSVYDSVKHDLRLGTLTNISQNHRFLCAQYPSDVGFECGPVPRTLDLLSFLSTQLPRR